MGGERQRLKKKNEQDLPQNLQLHPAWVVGRDGKKKTTKLLLSMKEEERKKNPTSNLRARSWLGRGSDN